MSETNHRTEETIPAEEPLTDMVEELGSSIPPEDIEMERKEHRKRVALVVLSCIYTFCFVGAFFGYGPMQLLLEEAGSFSSKCTNEEQENGTICPSQTAALLRVHFAAQTTLIFCPLLGTIADKFGAAALVLLMAVCNWVGLFLLIFAVAFELDVGIMHVAFVGIAISSFSGGLLTVQTGMVFQGKGQARIIFVLNSLFDAGGIAYLALWAIKKWTEHLSLTAILSGYFVFSIMVYGPSVYLWYNVKQEPRINVTTHHAESASLKDSEQRFVEGDGDNAFPADGQNAVSEAETSEETPLSVPTKDYTLVALRTQQQQLISAPYLLVTFISTVLVTLNMWTITTTRDFLAYLGDDETGNRYLSIFNLLMPISLVGVPFVDVIIHKLGFEAGFQGICILALGNNLIRLLSDDLNVQIVGFVLFSFFRCFLYGVSLSFLPTFLSEKTVGKATGLIYALTGGTAFLNIPLVNFAVETKNGDFTIPTLMYTLLLIPCFIASYFIGRCVDKEKAAKQKLGIGD